MDQLKSWYDNGQELKQNENWGRSTKKKLYSQNKLLIQKNCIHFEAIC